MSRMDSVRRGRKIRSVFLTGVLALASALVLTAPASASPPVGPTPTPTNGVTLVTSQSDGLLTGQAINLTVNTSGGTTLVGGLNVHLCRPGFANYGSTNFGYSGLNGTRCVYENGIVSGGLPGADYEQAYGPYAGSETTSGSLSFHVGTGTVTWGNVTGSGPFTLQADPTHPVDLVVQVNLAGDDIPTTYFVQPLTFASVPGAPTAVSAAAGNGAASVSFTAPADGGAPISNYSVSCTTLDVGSPGTGSGASSPIVVLGLTNLDTYTCTVTATNGAGTGPTSAVSNSFAPAEVPGPPTGPVATPGAGSASVAFTPPVDNGGSAIESYSVSCTALNGDPGSASGASSPVAVIGLTNGKTYSCTATATNSIGTGLPSAVSNSFVPEAVPTAPTLLSAVAGNGHATLSWTVPSNSATAGITGYTVTGFIGYYPAAHQTFNSTATTQVVTGLTNGKQYVFKVAAINAVGSGAQSGPVAAPVIGAPGAPTALHATAGTKQATLHFTAPATTNGAAVNAYVVTVLISGVARYGVRFNSAATTVTVKGLVKGWHYSFKVAARNARGAGLLSAVSNQIVTN